MWIELDSLFEVECRVQEQGDVTVREDLLDDVLKLRSVIVRYRAVGIG